MFFWMQEPSEDKDEKYCKKVNAFLNNPSIISRSKSASVTSTTGVNISDPFGSLTDSQLQSILGSVSKQDLEQLLVGGGGIDHFTFHRSESSPRASTSSEGGPSAKVPKSGPENGDHTGQPLMQHKREWLKLADLQSILSKIEGTGVEKKSSIDLSLGITSEKILPYLSNQEFLAKMKSHLPDVEEKEVANEIQSTISSPQFQQALQMFSSALQSGELAPLINQFGLGDSAIAAATAGDMKAFIEALVIKFRFNAKANGDNI